MGLYPYDLASRGGAAMIRVTLTLIVTVLGLIPTGPVAAGTPGDLHRDGGFEDARLGEPIGSFSGLELIGRDPVARTETYIRRSDDLRVGAAGVDGVTYSFYQGRLYFISLSMSGRSNSEAVLAAFERVYGESIATGTHPNERIWPGGSHFVLYDFDPATGRGVAALTSTPIHAQMRLDRSAPPGPTEDGF